MLSIWLLKINLPTGLEDNTIINYVKTLEDELKQEVSGGEYILRIIKMVISPLANRIIAIILKLKYLLLKSGVGLAFSFLGLLAS